jgi:hypothetical protein
MRASVCTCLATLFAVTAARGAEPEDIPEGDLRVVRTFKEPGAKHLGMLAFSGDGKQLVWAGERTVWLSEVASGKNLAKFACKNKAFAFDVALSADGKTVAASFAGEPEILLFDAASGEVRQRLKQGGYIGEFCLSADGRLVVSLGDGLEVRVWDAASGKELHQLSFGPPKRWWTTAERLALSPDGKIAAVGMLDEAASVRLCETATGSEFRRLAAKDNQGPIFSLAFSPDGKYLATDGQEDGFVIRLWEVGTGRLVRQFRLPPDKPTDDSPSSDPRLKRYGSGGSSCLAFSPDGKTLVNVGNGLELWEVASGRLRLRVPVNASPAAFSPDGRLLAGVTKDGPTLWNCRNLRLKRPDLLGPKELDRLWADLASEDAAVGYRAVAALIAWPKEAVGFLGDKLQPIPTVTPAQLAQLIADLDDDSFEVRERASRRLAVLNEAARPALLKALEKPPSDEVSGRAKKLLRLLDGPAPSERLRCLRAVEVLEAVGGEQARRVLRKLADGAEGAMESDDARAALARLGRRE